MEGDVAILAGLIVAMAFQSTPSAWRETRYSPTGTGAYTFQSTPSAWRETVSLHAEGDRFQQIRCNCVGSGRLSPSMRRETGKTEHTCGNTAGRHNQTYSGRLSPSMRRETAKLHRKAFFISPILVQSCKKGCKRLHSAPEKMVFFEKREKNLVRNLQHLSVRL